MKATLTVNMDNAAFDEDRAALELARTLRVLAHDVDGHSRAGLLRGRVFPVLDSNGNKVGELRIRQ